VVHRIPCITCPLLRGNWKFGLPMKRPSASPNPPEQPVELRIIGGDFRGRKLIYSGDLRTRPMKDRVREAVFNLLRKKVEGTYALDLFAGTGALGLEAVSRGAVGATFIERHFPTAKIIEQNMELLGIEDCCEVIPGSAFVWSRKMEMPQEYPWLVFCSPPYAFYQEQTATMLEFIQRFVDAAPSQSLIVVESNEEFDTALLPQANSWDVRVYPPAVISILEKA